MSAYRKKPVVIEAWRIDFANKPLPEWLNEAFRTDVVDWSPDGEGLYINTLEGCMLGNNGDMLIRGVKGELYACKPDIFEATYEDAALSLHQAAEPAPNERTGHWSTDPIGANLYCDSFAQDLKLSISGDFEDAEARRDCANELVRILNAALAASPAPRAVAEPGDFVMVPREPTMDMYDAAVLAYQNWSAAEVPWSEFTHNDVWKAMLSAAPAPTPSEDARMLDWLAANTGIELDWGEPEGGIEDDEYVWRVYKVSGSRNDREWIFKGQGNTPREAIRAAMSADGAVGELADLGINGSRCGTHGTSGS